MLAIKEKICNEQPNNPIERQKLIHAGRVLTNEQIISETAIKENDFIVLMLVTPKPTKVTIPKEENNLKGADSKTVESAESSLVTGNEYEQAIQRLIDMGFEKSNVIAAMRSSFNNPERAVEYLTSGVIPSFEVEQLAKPEDEPTNALDFLKDDPQFMQLRTLIQENPSMLGPIIEQLGQSSPELLVLLDNHKAEFYGLIMEGASHPEQLARQIGELADDDISEEYSDDNNEEDDAHHFVAPSPTPATNISTAPTNVLQVTAEERLAIERLESMGFEKARVVEAFFACDKNEELAANYLLNTLNDD